MKKRDLTKFPWKAVRIIERRNGEQFQFVTFHRTLEAAERTAAGGNVQGYSMKRIAGWTKLSSSPTPIFTAGDHMVSAPGD